MKHVHFIGIGGIGMSGIAQILREKGYVVSGSDLKLSHITTRLESIGCTIYSGHRDSNIKGADAVVISSAVSESNPELSAARRAGIKVLRRAEALASIMNDHKGIAVAGTHGKTTVSSMISYVLRKCGADPTVILGGELSAIHSNASSGHGDFVVAEADESDASFLYLSPYIAVITNIDSDVNLNVEPWVSCNYDYALTMKKVAEVFLTFTDRVRPEGAVVLCTDNACVRRVLPLIKRRCITYGITHEADLCAQDIHLAEFKSESRIFLNSSEIGVLSLNVPGKHNVQNALACIAVCLEAGLDAPSVIDALSSFGGLKRRFEILGTSCGVTVVDDYAHNPSKIRSAIHAAKTGYAGRVIAVCQPHRYSRMKFLMDEFSESFFEADKLIVTDIYAAGEKPIPGISSQVLCSLIRKKSPNLDAVCIPRMDDAISELNKTVKNGDLVITLGAGDICNLSAKFYKGLCEQKKYEPAAFIASSEFSLDDFDIAGRLCGGGQLAVYPAVL